MDILFDHKYDDEERRRRIYQGDVLILSPSPASLALVAFAREMIEAAFAPRHPQRAHEEIDVAKAVDILTRLKPQFIHDPRTKTYLQRLLLEARCDSERTYQDVTRLRVAYPADYLTTGIAYAHHAHRDTWYSAPACQFNWWMPLYDFEANQGMAFLPHYWNRDVKNGSAQFNYYRWNADGRKNAAQHVKRDTRVQPHAEEPLALEPNVRLVVPVGGIIIFSGAHLHLTVRNDTRRARWSIDFRTVNLDDVVDRRGAPIGDSACTGTSLRDFWRVKDFEPMPEEIVTQYDDVAVTDGVAVFAPGTEQPAEPAPSVQPELLPSAAS